MNLFKLKRKLSFSFLASLAGLATISSQNKPNVIVVLADDIGYGDISEYRKIDGQTSTLLQTPNLDQLVKDGMHFTDAHSPTALCAPTRYAVMTGQNTYNSYAPLGVWGSYQQSAITNQDMTLGKLMKNAGYNTSFIGKWHLGSDFLNTSTGNIHRGVDSPNVDLSKIVGKGPSEWGFDYSFVSPQGIQSFPYNWYENESWYKLGPDSTITMVDETFASQVEGGLGFEIDIAPGRGDSNWNPYKSGSLIANKAVIEIERNANAKEPFFLYFNSLAVHLPHTPEKELDGTLVRGTTPTRHLDMIKELDIQIGMMIKTLKEKGIYNNTVFIFTSDNGGLTRSNGVGHNASGSWKGNKNQKWEGGHRVPFIVTWPNRITAGSSYDGMASGVDIMSTLAAITNQNIPNTQSVDSFNLLPILFEDNNPVEREVMMLQSGTSKEAILREVDQNGVDWKLIMQYSNNQLLQTDLTVTGLYNLNNDPKENNNLMNNAAQSTRVANMKARYIDIRYGANPTKVINKSSSKTLSDYSSTSIPVGATIVLRKTTGGNQLLRIDTTNDDLIADGTTITEGSKFIVKQHANTGIYLESVLTGKIVRVFGANTTIPVRVQATAAGGWTPLEWLPQSGNQIKLKSVFTNNFFKLNNTNNKIFQNAAGSNDASIFEFEIIRNTAEIPIGKTVIIRKTTGNKEIVTINTSNDNLVVNGTNITNNAKFIVKEHPQNGIYLESVLTGKIVRVFGTNTTIPVRAQATTAGGWTPLEWLPQTGNQFKLKSILTGNGFVINTANNLIFPTGNTDNQASLFEFEEVNAGAKTINEFSSVFELDVYPNPFSIEAPLTIDLKGLTSTSVGIKIYSLSGQTILDEVISLDSTNNQTISMEVNNATSNSIYFVEVTDSNTSTITKVFCK